MAQLIDLGKLRFHFAGQWSSTTEYELNDVVKYGGNVYLYVYTLATVGNLPTNNNFWTLLVEGIKFQGVYNNAANYRVGDGVAHGGKVYICIADTIGNTPPNAAKWSPFADGIQYEGSYSNTANYQKNDIVVWGGNAYIAKQDSTGNKPNNTSYWDTFIQGVDATGVYNPATIYVPNQLVVYGNTYYRCIAESQGNVPTETLYWEEYLQGLGPQGTWSVATEYYKNDIVVDGSTVYIYKYDTPSTGNAVTNTTYWQVLTSGITTRGDWAPSTQYYSGDVVLRGGNTFITSQFHASSASFATDLAAGKWTKYNSGIRYRGAWAAATVYLEGDVITDGENARIANKDFTSGQYLADNENDWDILAKGATGLLPAQGGKAGYVLTTDGSEASFERDIVALRFGDGTDAADFEADAGLTDTAGVFVQDSTSFVQLALANIGTGTETSADFIAYANDGDNDSGFVDLGITGKQFVSEQYGITGPEEGYIFSSAAKSDKKLVTNKVVVTNLATLTTSTAHGYAQGDEVIVSISDSVYDGLRELTAVTTNTFSFGTATTSASSTAITGTDKQVWRPAGTGNFVIATDATGTDNKIIFAAGGFASGTEQMSITPDENVHIEIATASTSATTGALTVVGGVGITGDQYIAGDLTVIGNVDLQGVTKLPVGAGATQYETDAGLTNAIVIAAGNGINFVQNAIVNLGSGFSSSADYLAYAKEGDDETGWIDMGITNLSFNDPTYGLTGPHDGYIFMSAPDGTTGSGNLVIATDNTGTDNKIIFGAGGLGTGNEQMSITPNQNVHIEIATPSVSPTTGALTIVGGVGVQGDMNIAGAVNITGTITFGGSGTTVETDNLAVVSPMVFVATGNPTGDGLTFAFLGESRSQRTLTLPGTVTFRTASNGVATLNTLTAHSYEVNDSVVVSNVDDLAGLTVVIVYEITNNTNAKITTSVPHNLSVGNSISVSGVDAAVNGTQTITAVTSTTISFTVASTTNVAPSPVSGLVQRVSLPNVYNGTYTITEVPTPTSFRYNRAIPDEVTTAPSRVYPNVLSYSLTNGVVTLVINDVPQATVGASVTIAGVTSQLNGIRTITARSMTAPYSISYNRSLDDIPSTNLTTSVSASINSRNRTSGVATLTTTAAHTFVPGQSIVVNGVSGTFDGTHTISAVTSTTISYAQALSDVTETASSGTATASYPSYGSYAINGFTGNSLVTNPFRGQYTGLARNQSNQKWYLLGGLSEKPTTTIDFSVPGTTYTRNSLNVDTLEARNVILDKDPWGPLMAMTQQAAMIVPNIITTSQTLVARSVNTTEGTSVASGLYFVVFSNAMGLTLPASPTIGATIVITDISGNAGSFATKPKIMRNGSLIQGKAEDLVFDVSNGSIKLVFSNNTYGWRVTL